MTKESNGAGPGRETLQHRALSSVSRVHILRMLRAHDEPLDAHGVAELVGLHVNTVRAHLRVLEEARLVLSEPEARTRPGRPRVIYTALDDAAETGDPEGYRMLAGMLAAYLAGSSDDPEARAEEAGHGWGRYLTEAPAPFTDVSAEEAMDRLVGFFDELGFEPQARPANGRRHIDLHHCPFREVAEQHPEVVCSLHLGLLRGALEQLGAPLEATGLRPFVEPHVCVADLQLADV